MRPSPSPVRSRTRGARTATGPRPGMIARSGRRPWRPTRWRPSPVCVLAWLLRKAATSASTACANRARAPSRRTSVSGSENSAGWISLTTLSWIMACHSFGGEVEVSNTPTIRRLIPHAVTNFRAYLYKLPVMHTETNLSQGPNGDEAVNWLWKEWSNVLRVRNSGVPIVGFTWYSLTDQIDWDSALREQNGHVNPLGLYDLDRNIRPVGRACQRLIQRWRTVLPTESVCLTMPVVRPADFDSAHAVQQREEARDLRQSPPATPAVALGS